MNNSMTPSTGPRVLVLGTNNRKKGVELARLLAPWGMQLETLADYPDSIEVVEDGDSFAANAHLKAVEQARNLNRWVLAEDSGLAVDALGGEPGIFSARFAGDDATDTENNRHLLQRLADVPPARRTAGYVCHMTLSDPTGTVRAECEDTCRGRIRLEPAGDSGFGYDPLFEVVEYGRTMAQLGPAVKSLISHRGRALRQFVPKMLELVRQGAWDG